MTDRPIIFSASMIRALLDGRKTQTRRLLKLRGHKTISEFGPSDAPGYDWHFRDAQKRWHDLRDAELRARLPYAPGDRLWVKEASVDVHPLAVQDGRFIIEGRAGIPGPPGVRYRRVYRADGDVRQVWHSSKGYPYRTLAGPEDDVAAKYPSVCSEWVGRIKYQPWEPSNHMPRWASRLTLIVESVRVQRVQDISDADAVAEGITCENVIIDTSCAGGVHHEITADRYWSGAASDPDGGYEDGCEAFAPLWRSIHGRDAWDANPWVSAIGFRVVKANIGTLEHEKETDDD